jgi:type II secretory pathway predicted ATPase ExeA
MYLSHFGLNEPPFRITPHTDFFFEGANRGATLGALLYAISHEEGIIKITGEVGSGKTMLCRVLIERLPVHIETIYLANPSLSRDEILHTIADDLRVSVEGRRTTVLLRALQEDLIKRYAAGKRVVVLIDEAHAMPLETLEEIRLLSNLESNRHKLLHIVLFGQPELDEHLALPNMRQIKERIIHSFRLEPLVRDDITQYIEFRMRAAGYKGPSIFTRAALKIISQASEGLTRRVNILADKALLAAFADGTHQITVKHARAAVRDSEFRRKARMRSLWAIAAVGAAAGLLVGLFFHYFSAPRSASFTGAVVTAAPAIPAAPQKAAPKPPADMASTPAVSTTERSTAGGPEGASEQTLTAEPKPAHEPNGGTEAAHAPPPASGGPTAAKETAGAASGGVAAPAAPASASIAPSEKGAPSAPAESPARTVVSAATASSAPSPRGGAPAESTPASAPAPEQSMAPTPVLAPEGELARARFAATQEWLKTAPDKKYAIELLTVRRGKSDVLEDFVRQLSQLLDADSVHVYSVKIEGSQYYAVAYGNYASVADTVTAMGQLPETLKARAPYPRSFGRMRAQNQQ